MHEIIFNVRPACKSERNLLINSHYATAGKVFDWKFSSGSHCWLHDDTLESEVNKRKMILDHVQECRIVLIHNAMGKEQCEHKMADRVAEIVLSLPASFSAKKVTILDQGNLQA